MLGATLLRGAVLGFSIAAPLGPIGMLCMRRTAAHGWQAGVSCGLGAATADALYALVGGLAVTAVTRILVGARLWLGIAGGAFMLLLAIRTVTAGSRSNAAAGREPAHLSTYLSTAALTLANPMTIVSFAAVFAAAGATYASYATTVALAAGVLLGSTLWWCLLSAIVAQARRHMSAAVVRVLDWVCAVVIAGFGAYTLLTLPWSVLARS